MKRGEIWWADLDEPRGSEPGFKHPVVIIQADEFNQSRISTIIVAVISSNLELAHAPANIFLGKAESSLPKDSVINVSQILTIDRSYFLSFVTRCSGTTMRKLNDSLRIVLAWEQP